MSADSILLPDTSLIQILRSCMCVHRVAPSMGTGSEKAPLLQWICVLEAHNSPQTGSSDTPILPAQKPRGENQFVQDLGAVNGAVIPIHPLVPNPYNLLTQVPGSTQYFCFGPQRCIFLYSPTSRLSIAFGL